MEALNADLGFMVTSWLSSAATSRLRACSRECAAVFVRNCPVQTADGLWLEAREEPQLHKHSLAIRFGNNVAETVELEEAPRRNLWSPLRCWRLDLGEAGSLMRSVQLRELAAALFTDREFVVEVVERNGDAIQFADDAFKRDRDIVAKAVANDGMALQWMPPSLRDRDACMIAVTQNAWALQFAPDDIKRDRGVVLAAVRQNHNSLCIADASFRADPDVRRAAGLARQTSRTASGIVRQTSRTAAGLARQTSRAAAGLARQTSRAAGLVRKASDQPPWSSPRRHLSSVLSTASAILGKLL